MALYDNYLNPNNLYSRPSSLVSDVNNYLGANEASLPQDQTTLGSMAGLDDAVSAKAGGIDPGPVAYDFTTGRTHGGHTSGENIYGQEPDLLRDFMSKLGSLQPGHRKMLLKYIGTEGGDMTAGVSPAEWAELFGVSEEYSQRFEGYPDLLQLQDDIRNVYAGGEQKRGHELKAAQEAMIQSGQQRPGALKMGSRSNEIIRRQMQDTLQQRLFATKEDTASKYANLLSLLDSRINTGYNIAGDILNMNPDAQSNIRIDPETGSAVRAGFPTRGTDRATRRT